ncbi:MAG: hypothetical protein ACRDIU_11475 [Actinomycetota bacterium]
MARILDTIPDFVSFARKGGIESPLIRQQLHQEIYQAAHPEVFEAFFAEQPATEGLHALARELSKVRRRIDDAAAAMPGLIREIDPGVKEALGVESDREPLHVLMVGTFSTNAFVRKLGDDIAVFHCLEWWSGPQPTKVLIAHESAHAWHQIKMGKNPPPDIAWTAFYEGLGVRASREVVPEADENEYFWYGVPGFEDWLDACRNIEPELLKLFSEALGSKEGSEAFFGSGLVHKLWRSGFYIADLLLQRLDLPVRDLAGYSVDKGRKAIHQATREALED